MLRCACGVCCGVCCVCVLCCVCAPFPLPVASLSLPPAPLLLWEQVLLRCLCVCCDAYVCAVCCVCVAVCVLCVCMGVLCVLLCVCCAVLCCVLCVCVCAAMHMCVLCCVCVLLCVCVCCVARFLPGLRSMLSHLMCKHVSPSSCTQVLWFCVYLMYIWIGAGCQRQQLV